MLTLFTRDCRAKSIDLYLTAITAKRVKDDPRSTESALQRFWRRCLTR